jgi:transcriptional regulator with XRE-family HTH domain
MSDITRDYSFGGWLRSMRVQRDLTLRQAAKLLKLDPGNLSKLERSELSPPKSVKRIREICRVLNFQEGESILVSTAYQHHLSELKKDFEAL